jgi:hypothetical protein
VCDVEERIPMGARVRRPTTSGYAATMGSPVHENGLGPGHSGGRRHMDHGGATMLKSQSRRWCLGSIGGSSQDSYQDSGG